MSFGKLYIHEKPKDPKNSRMRPLPSWKTTKATEVMYHFKVIVNSKEGICVTVSAYVDHNTTVDEVASFIEDRIQCHFENSIFTVYTMKDTKGNLRRPFLGYIEKIRRLDSKIIAVGNLFQKAIGSSV